MGPSLSVDPRGVRPSSGAIAEDSDFSRLDFAHLWRGRERVVAAERSIVASLLEPLPVGRALEVGCGEGRISRVISRHCREYIAADLVPSFLERVRGSLERPGRRWFVQAAAERLPLADNSVDLVVLVRVYNFLRDPLVALAEIRRVLRPGGYLILSVNTRPSLGSWLDDLRYFVVLGGPDGKGSMTFSRSPVVPVRPSPLAAWAPRRSAVLSTLGSAGFFPVAERASGLEDYRLLGRLPPRSLERFSRIFGPLPIFPIRFLSSFVTKPGPSSEPPPDGIFACPTCRRVWPELENSAAAESCPRCFTTSHLESGVRRFEAGVSEGHSPPASGT